jgi:hypothetical protein
MSQLKRGYEPFTKQRFPDELKNELIKVLQLNYNNVYLAKELNFIKIQVNV